VLRGHGLAVLIDDPSGYLLRAEVRRDQQESPCD
jgi:hypothetical protein